MKNDRIIYPNISASRSRRAGALHAFLDMVFIILLVLFGSFAIFYKNQANKARTNMDPMAAEMKDLRKANGMMDLKIKSLTGELETAKKISDAATQRISQLEQTVAAAKAAAQAGIVPIAQPTGDAPADATTTGETAAASSSDTELVSSLPQPGAATAAPATTSNQKKIELPDFDDLEPTPAKKTEEATTTAKPAEKKTVETQEEPKTVTTKSSAKSDEDTPKKSSSTTSKKSLSEGSSASKSSNTKKSSAKSDAEDTPKKSSSSSSSSKKSSSSSSSSKTSSRSSDSGDRERSSSRSESQPVYQPQPQLQPQQQYYYQPTPVPSRKPIDFFTL